MRNPNGFGCVYKAAGNRRKPYIARITVGWDDKTGKQIFKHIGSHATYPEAVKALTDYHSDPYDLDATKVLFSELYEKWSERKYPNICTSNILGYKAAYLAAKEIHNLPFNTLKQHQFQSIVDSNAKGFRSKERLKMLFSQLCDFAIENDITSKNYAKYVNLGERPDPKLIRLPFTQDEIRTLFKLTHLYRYADTILMMIFTGIRPGELITIETENVFLDKDKNYFICGIKNSTSRNRKIPISALVKPFFEKYYYIAKTVGSKVLITNTENNQMRYSNYNRDKFSKIVNILGMKHMPHDCRHSFATYMDKVNASKLCIQNIMGHSPKVLVDKVYTHKTIEELYIEVAKLEAIFNVNEHVSLIDENYYSYKK